MYVKYENRINYGDDFMYDFFWIQDVLKSNIDNKKDKFIIYSLDENGIKIQDILKEYFDLEPCYIVDDEYCNYNKNIISTDTLKTVYKDDMCVIISKENASENSKIYKLLLEFVPAENIVNLNNQIVNEEFSRLQLKNILPDKRNVMEKVKSTSKIKVRILHNQPHYWNSLVSICKEFDKDPDFDILLIIGSPCHEGAIEQAEACCYPYIMYYDYRAELDKPDILILNDQTDRVTELPNCRKYVKLVVVASMTLIRYANTIDGFWVRMKSAFSRFSPDYYLFDSLLYKDIMCSDARGENIVEMGNAKFDGIYYAMQQKQYTGQWEKLKGKTTVVWTLDHGITGVGNILEAVTFDLYAKTFFEYAEKNQDMGFIFRPHIDLMTELVHFNYWGEKDVLKLKNYCIHSPNIVYDDTENYNCAFSIADGIMTDAFCGIFCTALPTMKPLCLAYRSKDSIPLYEDLAKCYYTAYESKHVVEFFDMIKNKQDPMLHLREKASEEYIKHFDGKNGWRIKEYIKEKYLEKMGTSDYKISSRSETE